MRTATVKKQNTPPAGQNVKRLEGWRERLLEAAGNMTYRQISERAIGYDGRPLAHTTVRSVMVGPGATNIETLAAICDALGTNIVQIMGGPHTVAAVPPPGGRLPPGAKVVAIPVFDIQDAHQWGERASQQALATDEILFTDEENATGLMAARITDSSMEDEFYIGDIVTFRRGKPKKDTLTIVRIEGQNNCMLRRWNPTSDGSRIKLTATNEDYGSQTIAESRLEVVGVLVGHSYKMRK